MNQDSPNNLQFRLMHREQTRKQNSGSQKRKASLEVCANGKGELKLVGLQRSQSQSLKFKNVGKIVRNYKINCFDIKSNENQTQKRIAIQKQILLKKQIANQSYMKNMGPFNIQKNPLMAITQNYSPLKTNQLPKNIKNSERKIGKLIDQCNRTVNFIGIDVSQSENTYNYVKETPKFANMRNQIHSGEGKLVSVGKGKNEEDFIKSIKKQIRLEENLRNLKHQIKPNQKDKIIDILKKKYQAGDIASLKIEENDPFFSHQRSYSPEQMATELFIAQRQADDHWSQKISKAFDKGNIEELFTKLRGQALGQMDVISMKGFARQLQKMLGQNKYLRSKDIIRIYERISPFNKLSFVKELGKTNQYMFRK